MTSGVLARTDLVRVKLSAPGFLSAVDVLKYALTPVALAIPGTKLRNSQVGAQGRGQLAGRASRDQGSDSPYFLPLWGVSSPL